MISAARRPKLTINRLLREARLFSEAESAHDEPALYGVTDGKAVGTYLEHKFVSHLLESYAFDRGNSASGIDLPGVEVDVKVTSIQQPQSSCPFKSARQKIYGLGYNLIVFVYEKTDDLEQRTGRLRILHCVFVRKEFTADFQMTKAVREILDREGNADDLKACFADKNLPVDEIMAENLADEILRNRPEQGYLTISNALQWRLQYGRVINQAGAVDGIVRVR